MCALVPTCVPAGIPALQACMGLPSQFLVSSRQLCLPQSQHPAAAHPRGVSSLIRRGSQGKFHCPAASLHSPSWGGQSSSSPDACMSLPCCCWSALKPATPLSTPGVGQIRPCSPAKPSVLKPRRGQEEPVPWGELWCCTPSPDWRSVRCPSPGTGRSSPLFPRMQQGVKRSASRRVCFSCSLTCSVLLEADPAVEKPGLVQKHKQASPLKPV